MENETISIICTVIGTGIAVITTFVSLFVYYTKRERKAAVEEYKRDEALKKVSSIDNIKDNHNQLECVKNPGFADNVKQSLEILKSNQKILTSIAKWVMRQDGEMINELTQNLFGQKMSPYQLSPLGEKIYSEIDGKSFLIKHQEELFEKIELNELFTALDVERYAYNAINLMMPTPYFNHFKNYVYHAPPLNIELEGAMVQHNIKLSDLCFILAIPLRDMYLEAHPEVEGKNEVKFH